METKHIYTLLYSDVEAKMLQDADDVVTRLELWDWLAEFNPTAGEGFMFTHHPNLNRIIEVLSFQGHSGASFAWTMRTLQKVARLGWSAFAEVCATDSPPCPCRKSRGKWAGWCGVAGGGVPACDH